MYSLDSMFWLSLFNPQSFHLNPKVYFRAGTTNDWEQHLSPLAQEAINAKTTELWGADPSCPPLIDLKTLNRNEVV